MSLAKGEIEDGTHPAMSSPLPRPDLGAMENRFPAPNGPPDLRPLSANSGRSPTENRGRESLPRVPGLLDERSPRDFRALFGSLLSRSHTLDTAILRIRLGAVDLSRREVTEVRRIRVLVAEVSARTLEEEAYALVVDPEKRENLERILDLLQRGSLEIRSAPLGGWSPDFSVFSREDAPFAVLIGLHWFQKPFPHRGPAWASWFGPDEACRAERRFSGIWSGAHDIGPAIRKLLEGAAHRCGARGKAG